MKKIIFSLLFAAILISGLGSCSKPPNDQPDLTTNLVGTYVGTYADSLAGGGTTSSSGVILVISKIDNTHVQVTPPASSNFIPFTALLSAAPNGTYLTVVSGTFAGNTLYTGSQIYTNLPEPYNGGYSPATNQIGFSIFAGSGGNNYYEIFAGSK